MSFAVNSYQTFFFYVVLILDVYGRPDGWVEGALSSIDSEVNFRPSTKFHLTPSTANNFLSSISRRSKRGPEHHINECMFMTSEEGVFYHKAMDNPDGKACGIYVFTEPDQNIEIRFNYLDVTCDNGGLVVVVDGWELNGQVFPSPADHPKTLKSRFSEFCGQRKLRQAFISSQNVALIQYRMPVRAASFSFSVHFVKNPSPCNALIQDEQVFTLRNYNKRSNCTLSSLFPAAVNILGINVAITPARERGIEFETGTIHKCQKRGLNDYVQIGGSLGLDNGNMEIADTLCGLDSKPGRHMNYIACETTNVRLVSSGAYDNGVTVSFIKLSEDNMNVHLNLICLPDDLPLLE